MNLSVLCTCNGFWNRFEFCRSSWKEALKFVPSDHEVHFEVITLDDIKEPKPPFEVQRIDPALVRKGNLCESKPQMLYQRIVRQSDADYILFTDADIIVPKDVLVKAVSFNGSYAVADRLETNESEANYIMSFGIIPQTVLDRNPIEKKRGMGWFQLIDMRLLSKVWSQLDWNQDGYDVFDWSLNEKLSELEAPTVIHFDNPFIHLWHGDPGSTWKGIKEGQSL